MLWMTELIDVNGRVFYYKSLLLKRCPLPSVLYVVI